MNIFNGRSRETVHGGLSQFMFGSRNRVNDFEAREQTEAEMESKEEETKEKESEELIANVDYEKLTESLETLIGLYEQYKPELHPMLHKLLSKDSQ